MNVQDKTPAPAKLNNSNNTEAPRSFEEAYNLLVDDIDALLENIQDLMRFYKLAVSGGSVADTEPKNTPGQWTLPRSVLVTNITSPKHDPVRKIAFGETMDGHTVFLPHHVVLDMHAEAVGIGDPVSLEIRKNPREGGTDYLALRYLGRVK